MYLAYLGVTLPLLKGARGLARQPARCEGGLFALGIWANPLNIIGDRLRRRHGHQPPVAAHRAVRGRHLQVGPDRRHDLPRGIRARSTTTRFSSTRAACSRSTAPRPRQATELPGAGGRRARPPRAGRSWMNRSGSSPAATRRRFAAACCSRSSPSSSRSSGSFAGPIAGGIAMVVAAFVQINVIVAWLAGPRFMAARRPLLAPGVAGGHSVRYGGMGGLRGGRRVHRFDPGRGSRHDRDRHDDRREPGAG